MLARIGGAGRQRPPRLPAAADPRSRRGAAAAGQRRPARGAGPGQPGPGHRARDRGPVRRSARASPGWPRAGCPTTSCSCSTSISRPWARRSRARAAGSTSSSATASWRCSASTSSPRTACRQALAGARAMAQALDRLNQELEHDLREPLRMGIGLHAGPVILGEMGYRRATGADRDRRYRQRRLAARGADQGVRRAAGGLGRGSPSAPGSSLRAFELREIEIRGRRRPLRVRLVADAQPAARGRRGRQRDRRHRPGCSWSTAVGAPCGRHRDNQSGGASMNATARHCAMRRLRAG